MALTASSQRQDIRPVEDVQSIKPSHKGRRIDGHHTSSPQSMASLSFPFALFHISSNCYHIVSAAISHERRRHGHIEPLFPTTSPGPPCPWHAPTRAQFPELCIGLVSYEDDKRGDMNPQQPHVDALAPRQQVDWIEL